MKLVADVDTITSNLNPLSAEIDNFSSAVSSFDGASINCPVEEVSGVLDSYKSSISDDLNKLNTSSGEYKTLVTECCSEYKANEANTQSIDISCIDEIIKNSEEVVKDYKGNAASKLTGLPSTEIRGGMSEGTVFLTKDGRLVVSKSNTVNDAMAWALKTADDDSIGYSQATRWGDPNYDCSSLVISAYEAAGIPVKENGATYTGNMRDAFLATGQFEWIPGDPDPNSLQPGDIVLNEANHVEMYVGNGQTIGAHDNFDGCDGDSSGSEINVSGYYSYPWNGVLRYVGDD